MNTALDIVELLFAFGIGSALVVSALAFLGKKIIEGGVKAAEARYRMHLEQQNIEFRAKLESTLSEARQRLQSDLDRVNEEHRLRYNWLQTRQSRVIHRIYQRLSRAHRALISAIDFFPIDDRPEHEQHADIQQAIDEAYDAQNELRIAFQDNRHLVPAALRKEIQLAIQLLGASLGGYTQPLKTEKGWMPNNVPALQSLNVALRDLREVTENRIQRWLTTGVLQDIDEHPVKDLNDKTQKTVGL